MLPRGPAGQFGESDIRRSKETLKYSEGMTVAVAC